MKARIVQTRFWDDEFVTECDIYTQHLYIYLLTSQYINISGIFQLPSKKIMFECKLTEKQFQSAKENLEKSKKVFFYGGWVWVVNAKKNNNYTKSPDNQKACNNELNKIPEEVCAHFGSISDSSVHSTPLEYSREYPKIRNKKRKGGMGEKQEIKKTTKIKSSENHPTRSLLGNRKKRHEKKTTPFKSYWDKKDEKDIEVVSLNEQQIWDIAWEMKVPLPIVKRKYERVMAWANEGKLKDNVSFTLKSWLGRDVDDKKIETIEDSWMDLEELKDQHPKMKEAVKKHVSELRKDGIL